MRSIVAGSSPMAPFAPSAPSVPVAWLPVAAVLGLLAGLGLACPAAAAPDLEADDSRRRAAPIAGDAPVGFDDCPDGVIKDDGSVETGYGWVPSAIVGEYLQVYEIPDFPGPVVSSVCICWLRTNINDPSIGFEVVFYREVDGVPADEPFAAFPARLEDVPAGVPAATFVEVETPVTLRNERVLIGVRWDPSADERFFVCADHTEGNPVTEVWFRDDRAEEWGTVLDTNDPIFQNHRAIFVRPVAGEQFAVEVPMLPLDGLLVFAVALLGVGLVLARRRV